MVLHPKQIEAVLRLPGPERYKHFIKQVADTEKVWGLYKDGWALAATGDGTEVFPVWPAKEYATLCAKDEWLGFEPSEISLNDFMNELLPKLKAGGKLPGVFYTPNDKGVTLEIRQLLADLEKELENY